MKNKIGDKARLQHIFDAILEIEGYLVKKTVRDFMNNSMLRFACIKQLEIIGEAANHLSQQLIKANPDIQWIEIIGLRNLLIHEYFGVNEKIVWEIIKNDIPALKKGMQSILDKLA